MSNTVKVRIDLAAQSEVPFGGERVWADDLGGGLYRLRNVPCYATGLAEGDVVECEDVAGTLTVSGLVTDSGNGVVRVYFGCSDETGRDAVVARLKELGCSYERASATLFLFNIPSSAAHTVEDLAAVLNEADQVEGWEWGKMPSSLAVS